MAKVNPSEVVIQNAFTQGVIAGKGLTDTPPSFAGYLRNGRLENMSICPRGGFEALATIRPIVPGGIRAMCSMNGEIYFIHGTTLYNTVNSFGNLPASNGYTMLVYGNMIIILTGVSKPYIFIGGVLSVVDDINMPLRASGGAIPYYTNQILGETLKGYTFLAGNEPGHYNELYMSRPISPEQLGHPATGQKNAYDWNQNYKYFTAPGVIDPLDVPGQSRTFSSDILALKSNINTCYIFCERTIETIDQGNLKDLGGQPYITSQPIGDGDQVLNSKCVVSAGKMIFYITKQLIIKTIGYVPGVTDPDIGTLSERKQKTIKGFMDNEIDRRNQSDAFGEYCRTDETIRFFLYTKSGMNVAVVYSLINDEFYVDDNMNINTMCYNTNNQGTVLVAGDKYQRNLHVVDYRHDGTKILYDNYGSGAVGINFEYDTINISLGNPGMMKLFKGYSLSGALNKYTTLGIKVYVDGHEVFTRDFTINKLSQYDLVNANNGGTEKTVAQLIADNALFPFEFIADHGNVRKRGKRIRIKITGNGVNQDFYLDFLSLFIRAINTYDLADKL